MTTVRIWFRKEGTARYISHLDLNRCMARAIRRARLPVWCTEGFNPHPFLTFALPLSLGVTGLNESMDIKMEQMPDPDEVKKQLNAVLPAGLTVISVAQAEQKPGLIAAADYEVELLECSVPLAEAMSRTASFFQQETIMARKKNKKGEWRDLDLKPLILQAFLRKKSESLVLSLRLPAGSGENVNPALLLDALFDYGGFAARPETTRTEMRTASGEIFR